MPIKLGFFVGNLECLFKAIQGTIKNGANLI